MLGQRQILRGLVIFACIDNRDRLFKAIDRTLLQRGIHIAQRHGSRVRTQHLHALHLDIVTRHTDLHALQVRQRADRLFGQNVTVAVNPVRGKDF